MSDDDWIRSHRRPGPFADYYRDQAAEVLPDVKSPTFGLRPGELPAEVVEPRQTWRTPLREDQLPGPQVDDDEWLRAAAEDAGYRKRISQGRG